MIINSKKEIYNGIIKRILMPQEYDDYNELKEDFEVSNLWFKVEVNNKEIDVIVPRTKEYRDFFVKDNVRLIKTTTLYTKDEYEEKLMEQINIYCSYLPSRQRKEKYHQVLKEKNNYYITNYDIVEA